MDNHKAKEVILKYTFELDGEQFSETDTFVNDKDPSGQVTREVLEPLNKRRETLGEPKLKLVKVQVTNPFVHLHDWEKGKTDKFTLKQHLKCRRCGMPAYHKINLFGGAGIAVFRDPPHHQNKFDLCKDELKKVPLLLFKRSQEDAPIKIHSNIFRKRK